MNLVNVNGGGVGDMLVRLIARSIGEAKIQRLWLAKLGFRCPLPALNIPLLGMHL